jgi:hypothetical protein
MCAMTRRTRALWAVAALLAVNVVLVGAQLAGAALPKGLGAYFFGPKMVRAEVILMEGTELKDYRVDRGRIRDRPVPGSLTLRERDGTIVTLAVAPDAAITVNGRPIGFDRLRRGMTVLTVREGDGPVIEVRASGR